MTRSRGYTQFTREARQRAARDEVESLLARGRRLRAEYADCAAVEVLCGPGTLAEKQQALTALAARAAEAAGLRCPECDDDDIEDNGCDDDDVVFRCGSCGHMWGPGAEV